MDLLADSHASALYTAAEMFDLPVTNVSARQADEWEDEDHSQQEK